MDFVEKREWVSHENFVFRFWRLRWGGSFLEREEKGGFLLCGFDKFWEDPPCPFRSERSDEFNFALVRRVHYSTSLTCRQYLFRGLIHICVFAGEIKVKSVTLLNLIRLWLWRTKYISCNNKFDDLRVYSSVNWECPTNIYRNYTYINICLIWE